METLEEAVHRLGGRVEKVGDEVRLVFRKRGVSLADLPPEALRELLRYKQIIVVEESYGEGNIGYYYYVRPESVEKLLKMLQGEKS